MRTAFGVCVAALGLTLAFAPLIARAQQAWVPCAMADATCFAPHVPREFRGVWVASVANIDWPSKKGLTAAAAKREMIALLDLAKAMGLNAVVLQVRPAADAIYPSKLEPWSEYLTGRQGVAPRPRWDPLEFAVTEAHRRGLELHAWFNPYRAKHPGATGPLARTHIANARPSLVRKYGQYLWMDPGDPAVRELTRRVVADVVSRYDVDGVHMDDYFYPYPERDAAGEIDFPDSVTYARYLASAGTLAKADWRRANVDSLVRDLDRTVHAIKPWVKLGISPFGIWRPGFPEQVTGFDAYDKLFADSKLWFTKGWVDYLTPQLYWPVDQAAQSYPVLLDWWAQQNAEARHLWPGNFSSRVGEKSARAWTAGELRRQVAITRAAPGATGNVHFSMKVFLEDRDSIASRLKGEEYATLAMVPASPWMRDTLAAGLKPPTVRVTRGASGPVLSLREVRGERPRWWLVQWRGRDGAWKAARHPASLRTLTLPVGTDRVVVRGIDRAGLAGAIVPLRPRR